MRFTIEYEDGTSVEVAPAPADVLAFEDKHNTTLSAAMTSGSPKWTYFLAWNWLQRKQAESRSFDAWLETVVAVRSTKADDAADPTGAGPAASDTAASSQP